MIRTELLTQDPRETAPRNESDRPKHVAIITWAMSKNEPHLFFWRDHNSYANDAFFSVGVENGASLSETAREAVKDMLVFEGVPEEEAKKSIKKTSEKGRLLLSYYAGIKDGKMKWDRQSVPAVFVEVKPSLLNRLEKEGGHLLFSHEVLRPRSNWNDRVEKRVLRAFKNFAENT